MVRTVLAKCVEVSEQTVSGELTETTTKQLGDLRLIDAKERPLALGSTRAAESAQRCAEEPTLGECLFGSEL
jgi:hypothetical protein